MNAQRLNFAIRLYSILSPHVHQTFTCHIFSPVGHPLVRNFIDCIFFRCLFQRFFSKRFFWTII